MVCYIGMLWYGTKIITDEMERMKMGGNNNICMKSGVLNGGEGGF